MAISLSEIEDYRALAAKYPSTKGAKAINHLLNEIQSLRRLCNTWQAREFAGKGKGVPLNDSNLMPFGKYKDELLSTVPLDYLRWWMGKQDIPSLEMKAQWSDYPERGVALSRLRLCDYIKERSKADVMWGAIDSIEQGQLINGETNRAAGIHTNGNTDNHHGTQAGASS